MGLVIKSIMLVKGLVIRTSSPVDSYEPVSMHANALNLVSRIRLAIGAKGYLATVTISKML
jgi:hypothetical protein